MFTRKFLRSQLQRVPELERLLRDRDGPEQRGRVQAVPDLGEAALEVPQAVHGVRVADRPEPQPPGLPGERRQAAAPGGAVHAAPAQRHDLHARGQQDLPRGARQLREDAHAGANDAHHPLLSEQTSR